MGAARMLSAHNLIGEAIAAPGAQGRRTACLRRRETVDDASVLRAARVSCRAARAPWQDQRSGCSWTFGDIVADARPSISLGLLQYGRQRVGERARACDPVRGGDVESQGVRSGLCRIPSGCA